MGRYLNILRRDTTEVKEDNLEVTYEITKKAHNKEDTNLPDTDRGASTHPSRYSESSTKETKLTKEGSETTAQIRKLPPDELARLDLRFRIVAPDEADTWSLDDWIEWISERSAILEFDDGYSREQADQEAMLIWKLYRGGEQ
jgi:hypothetical protein